MKEYSETVRARMVARMMSPRAVPMSQLSRDSGIPEGTLYRWLKRAARIPDMAKAPGRKTASEEPQATERSDRRRTGAQKLALVARAEGLEGDELGEFLRREGVHLAELEQWRKLAEQALQGEPKRLPPSKEIRRLQAELARKEKALAEAAALIILKKKVAAIWGDEDDGTEGTNEP
jgi:transposase-like protein